MSSSNDPLGRPPGHGHVIYQWFTSAEFLLPCLWPAAELIDAGLDDDPGEVVARIPDGARWFHFHLNCTHTGHFPRARTGLLDHLRRRGLRPVNASVTDISKSRIQTACAELGLPTTRAAPQGDPDEMVIVKTELNFGGDSEWGIPEADRAGLGIPPGSDLIWKPDHYRVVARAEVDARWWKDPSLIIERFVENDAHRWYRAFCSFSACFLCELQNPSAIKKVGDSALVGSWQLDLSRSEQPGGAATSVVEQLRRFAPAFGLEFGAVDFVVDQLGVPHLIDVNTTPAYNHSIPGLAEALRSGLPAA